MKKLIKTGDLFDTQGSLLSPLFSYCPYPWDILPKIKPFIVELINDGIDGYTLLKPGVLIGRDVEISETATIVAPAIIGHGTVLRCGAYIRGSVIISDGCVIGNSCELKNCIILSGAQIPHYNYIGDSIIGKRAHLGAGAICSNLKSDGKNVIIHSDIDYDTSLRKVGGFIGDGAEIGCHSVINPGTVVGRRTSVYPLTSLRGVYPPDCIVKSAKDIVKRI